MINTINGSKPELFEYRGTKFTTEIQESCENIAECWADILSDPHTYGKEIVIVGSSTESKRLKLLFASLSHLNTVNKEEILPVSFSYSTNKTTCTKGKHRGVFTILS